MVRSLVENCCPLWHPSKISDIQKLESVQKTFISRITGMKELHYYDQLIHLSLMSLQRRRERFILLHLWKIVHGKTSNDLNIQFVSRPKLGTLAIIPSKSRTSSAANQTLFDNSFAVQGPKLWNAMPHHLNSTRISSISKISSPSSCCPSLICRLSGNTVLQIPTLCCPNEFSEAILRFGVVGIADGPVKF